MTTETKPNLSVEYGNGLGRVSITDTKNVSRTMLRDIVRAQMDNGGSSIMVFTYRDGRSIPTKRGILKEAGALPEPHRTRFISGVVRQIRKAEKITITQEVESEPRYKELRDPLSKFIEDEL